jgi:hypothetical protein
MLRSPPFVAPGAAGVDLSILFRNQQTSKINGAEVSLPRVSWLKHASVRSRGCG